MGNDTQSPLPVTRDQASDTRIEPARAGRGAGGGRATFVTMATPDRAAQSRIFARSARNCYPDARLVVLALGPDGSPRMFEDLFDLVLSAEQLSLSSLDDMRFRYSTPELCFALKPWIMRHLFEKFPDEPVYYFDSDIELFTPLAEVEAALAGGAGLVLTPHLLQPTPDQESEESVLRSGTFNGGFLVVAPNPQGCGFIDWWGERLKTGCTIDATCGDQRWLDLVPSFFEGAVVLRHPGYNFACWNAHQRPLVRRDGAWAAAGLPLRFVHYTKWNLREQNSEQYLAKNFHCEYRSFAGIFAEYQRKVLGEDRFGKERSQGVYGELLTPSGKPVPDLVRGAYARHGPTVEGDASEVFARAVAVLNAPSRTRADLPDLPISILYDEMWQRHADLRYRFAVDEVSGRRDYLRFLAEFGLAGLGIPAEFATPARSVLGLPELPEAADAASGSVEWLPLMQVGPAGERRDDGVGAAAGQAGHLVFGPYARLGAGNYRVRVRLSAGRRLRVIPHGQPVATIEVVSGDGKTFLAQRELRIDNYTRPEHELSFGLRDSALQAAPVEVRVWTSGVVPFTVSSITVERISASARTVTTR